jgi:hypothetical protein
MYIHVWVSSILNWQAAHNKVMRRLSVGISMPKPVLRVRHATYTGCLPQRIAFVRCWCHAVRLFIRAFLPTPALSVSHAAS